MSSSSPDPQQNHQRWKVGLIGFYLSCAGVALGATLAGGSYFFFGSKVGLVFGICLSTISVITCFYSLAAARRVPADPR